MMKSTDFKMIEIIRYGTECTEYVIEVKTVDGGKCTVDVDLSPHTGDVSYFTVENVKKSKLVNKFIKQLEEANDYIATVKELL